MEITLDSADGVPAGIKSLVSEADGKFTLDLTKLAPSSELEKFKGKALTAEQEAIDRRKALEGWKALGESPDAVKQALAAKGKPDADQEAIIEQMKADHAAKLADKDSALQNLMRSNATESLKAELAKAGVVPEGIDLLAGFASPRIQFNEDGTAKVLSDDGKTPMIGSGPNGGATLADLAGKLAETIPHLVKDGGKGGGGKPPNEGGKPATKTVTRSQFDAMSHVERAAHSKDGGKVVDA